MLVERAARGDMAAVRGLESLSAGDGTFAASAASHLLRLAERLAPWVARARSSQRPRPQRSNPLEGLTPEELVGRMDAFSDGLELRSRRQYREAFEALPIEHVRPLAMQWLEVDPQASRRRLAASAFAEGSEAQDVPFVRRMLTREPDLPDGDADQYVICELSRALGFHPELGPFHELRRAFGEMPYAFGRRFAAESLAANRRALRVHARR
ncbi:MAG: hypothetical protein PGN13_13240 [Patulibacter minatonensis]